MCSYQGYEFGGGYLDSTCIDGYLWDADSGGCDDDGNVFLDSGGDIPCPSCNSDSWMSHWREEIIAIGCEQGEQNERPKVLMYGGYPLVIRTNTKAMRKAKRWIMRGYYKGKKERAKDIKQAA